MGIMESAPGAYTVIDGRRRLYFSGTGYLGLQGHPEVIRAACEAVRQYGLHTATSRTGFGTSPPLANLERRAAEFFGMETAFCYASGYPGNGILLALLADSYDAIWIDEYSHYSIQEAAAATRRPVHLFRHQDAADLAESLRLRLKPGERPLVMTDGVFSVRATIAPVDQYVRILRDYPGGMLLVDDAHGVGVLGENGRGTLEYRGLMSGGVNAVGAPIYFAATLSKALGGYGGVLPGSEAFFRKIDAASPWFNGATPPPAPVTAASAKAIELIQADPGMRDRLRTNVRQLKTGLRQMGLDVDETPVPIVCLIVGDGANMQRIQETLFEQDIVVNYVEEYSGLGAEGALRLAVFATHTAEMIDRLLASLQRCL